MVWRFFGYYIRGKIKLVFKGLLLIYINFLLSFN